jgi:phytoene dehydrogenase-like protein
VPSSQGDSYDVIVVGAGHNGLACACYLARAGLRVLALDRYSEVGGMTITHELTLPDHYSDVHASGFLVAKMTPAPEELDLADYGLELITPDPNWVHLLPGGRAIEIHREVEQTAAGIAEISERDAAAWRAMYERYEQQRSGIVAGMCSSPPSLTDHVQEVTGGDASAYRFETQTARSAANEAFESDEMRTLFASFAMHAAASPDDVGGGAFAWLFASAVQDVGCSLVKGGMHAVSLALARDLQAHGGEVRTAAPVSRILVDDGRCAGVELEDGETIAAHTVASSVDPLHFAADLLGEEALGAETVAKARRYEFGDSFFTVYAALDGPPEYAAGEEAARACYLHAGADSVEDLSLTYAHCRAGLLPATPMLGVINESLVDPSRTPEGAHLIKLVAHFVPYDIGGDATASGIAGTEWDEVKEAYADYLVDRLTEEHIPSLRERIVKRVVQSPVDLERRMPSAVRGTHQHGAFLPYQTGPMRPIPELGGYRSSIEGVYLCGAGSHPGSGVSMAPGRNAAARIAGDIGADFPGRDLARAAT